MEAMFGSTKILIIYLLSGIGGNLFSSILSDTLAVGASTSIMGILGCIVGFMIMNWSKLPR